MTTTAVSRPDLKQDAPVVVHQLVGMCFGQRLAWAALTLQSPGRAFANVAIDDAVPSCERRRFVGAVVAAVRELGAGQVLLVVSKKDLKLFDHGHARLRVRTVDPVGQTYLVRADLEERVLQLDPVLCCPCSGALEIGIETLSNENDDDKDDESTLATSIFDHRVSTADVSAG